MKIKYLFTAFILSLLVLSASAQDTNTNENLPATGGQSIRGKVIDKESKYQLVGVVVKLLSVTPNKTTVTNEDGEFKFANITPGRHTIKISYIGYESPTLENLLLTIGKELYVNVELTEQVLSSKEVEIVAQRDKTEADNEMATVSARTFSVEETGKYAGSRNDPARMAQNFAGVSGANDGRNDIIVRGNSPLGILWRLEGIDIPNPSHFGALGSSGGPVSILNNNTLANSDFFTGAFPASYGNATSGVFDLQMRNGNNQKREYLGQVGFNGFEFGAEGPFKKGGKSSYLINYRYSTLGVFKAIGINFGTGASIPQYQDLSYKLNFHSKKLGRFVLFGIGGKSHIDLLDKDNDGNSLYNEKGYDIIYGTNVGVLGLTNLNFINPSTYYKLSFSVSGSGNSAYRDSVLGVAAKNPQRIYTNNSANGRFSAKFDINKKFNVKNTILGGVIFENYFINFNDKILKYNNNTPYFRELTNVNTQADLLQAHAQWQHKFSDKLTLNSGFHFQYFIFNKATAYEPRLGVKWEPKAGHKISLGAGLHSQLQPLYTYFVKTDLGQNSGNYANTNTNMGFTKSQQLILAYDKSLGKNARLKLESYYQNIYNVPVEQQLSTFSMLNAGADFSMPSNDSLVNKGTGKNYGVELTLEKFMSKGFYYLLTASAFESKYKGSDGVERNTAFNGNYVVNALVGKEFKFGSKHTLSLDIKSTSAGGRRYIPINEAQSLKENQPVYVYSQSFENQLRDYYRTDVKVSYRLDGKKTTQEWAFDIQNIFNRKNDFLPTYNRTAGKIAIVPQLGIFPVVQYKISW